MQLLEEGRHVLSGQCRRRIRRAGPLEDRRDLGGVQQHDVVGPSDVESPQHPEVLGPLLGRGEREQPEPIVLHPGPRVGVPGGRLRFVHRDRVGGGGPRATQPPGAVRATPGAGGAAVPRVGVRSSPGSGTSPLGQLSAGVVSVGSASRRVSAAAACAAASSPPEPVPLAAQVDDLGPQFVASIAGRGLGGPRGGRRDASLLEGAAQFLDAGAFRREIGVEPGHGRGGRGRLLLRRGAGVRQFVTQGRELRFEPGELLLLGGDGRPVLGDLRGVRGRGGVDAFLPGAQCVRVLLGRSCRLVAMRGLEVPDPGVVRGAGVRQLAVDGLDGGLRVVAVLGCLGELLAQAGDPGIRVRLHLRQLRGGPGHLRLECVRVGELVDGRGDLRGDGVVLRERRRVQGAERGDGGRQVGGCFGRARGSGQLGQGGRLPLLPFAFSVGPDPVCGGRVLARPSRLRARVGHALVGHALVGQGVAGARFAHGFLISVGGCRHIYQGEGEARRR